MCSSSLNDEQGRLRNDMSLHMKRISYTGHAFMPKYRAFSEAGTHSYEAGGTGVPNWAGFPASRSGGIGIGLPASSMFPVANAKGTFGPQTYSVLGAASSRPIGVSSFTRSPSE
jgi:hypothetical protein